jgi:hypothetical protein
MIEWALHLVTVLGSALASAALLYGTLTALRSLGELMVSRRTSWLNRMWAAPSKGQSLMSVSVTASAKQSPLPYIVGGAAILMALKASVTGNVEVGAYILLLGAGAAWYFAREDRTKAQGKALTEATERMITAFRSHYTLNGACFAALEGTLPDINNPYLEDLVRRTISSFRIRGDKAEALGWLEKAHNTYLNQFVFILNRESQSSPQAVARMLESVVRRLEAKHRLDRRLRVAMGPLEGTVRFLEAANGVALLVVLNVPFWWNYYATTPMMLLIGMAAAVAASLYFDYRVRVLSDKAL